MRRLAELRCAGCGAPACPDPAPNPDAIRIIAVDLDAAFCSPACAIPAGWPWLASQARRAPDVVAPPA